MNVIKKLFYNIILGKRADVIFTNNNKITSIYKSSGSEKIISFGKMHPDKYFYVIKRSPGAGFFSNLSFVLCNLKIAYDKKFIPIIDMENFTTWYNEKEKIDGSYNSWNYFFENINNYSLEEVYKSKNVIFSNNEYPAGMPMSPSKSKELVKIFNENIFVKKNILKIYDNFYKNYIFGRKVLGVHFRGCDLKSYRGHPFPATSKQMINICKKLIHEYDLIFLSTEEKKYQDIFFKEFKNKVICFNSYRSYKNAYLYYPRKNHRYLLGRDILIESMLLSSCDNFIFTNSNVSEAAKIFSINKNLELYEIKNGRNSNNILVSRWLWFYKSIAPVFLGGFDKFGANK